VEKAGGRAADLHGGEASGAVCDDHAACAAGEHDEFPPPGPAQLFRAIGEEISTQKQEARPCIIFGRYIALDPVIEELLTE